MPSISARLWCHGRKWRRPHTGANQSLETCRVCPALSELHGLSSLHPLGRAFVGPGSVCITGSEVPAESLGSGDPESLPCFLQAFHGIDTYSAFGRLVVLSSVRALCASQAPRCRPKALTQGLLEPVVFSSGFPWLQRMFRFWEADRASVGPGVVMLRRSECRPTALLCKGGTNPSCLELRGACPSLAHSPGSAVLRRSRSSDACGAM